MNFNVGIENPSLIVYDGSNYIRDISGFVAFGFTFEAREDIAVDTVFRVMYADASDADPCVPGTLKPVPEVAICSAPALPGAEAQVTIPAGTPAGTICAGTIPCIPGKFITLTAYGGEPNKVFATISYSGPMN